MLTFVPFDTALMTPWAVLGPLRTLAPMFGVTMYVPVRLRSNFSAATAFAAEAEGVVVGFASVGAAAQDFVDLGLDGGVCVPGGLQAVPAVRPGAPLPGDDLLGDLLDALARRVGGGVCGDGCAPQRPGNVRIVRGDESADVAAVDGHGPCAHLAAGHVALGDGEGRGPGFGDDADVIPGTGAIPHAVVLPVIHDGVAQFGHVGVILDPDAFVLGEAGEFLHPALGPGVRGQTARNPRRGHGGGTVGVVDLHLVPAGQGPVVVVNFQNLRMFGAPFGGADP